MRILYIEDEPKMARLVKQALEEAGYDVDVAHDGGEGLERGLERDYELVVIDYFLPSMSGEQVCRSLRQQGKTMPIVMLTARRALGDIIEGLDAGADEYITKPFEIDEFLARVRALRRRLLERTTILSYRDLSLDVVTREVRTAAGIVQVSDREFRVLQYLLQNASQTVSRADLVHHVWGMSFDPQTNLVDVVIKHLRTKIDRGRPDSFIVTVRGFGYRVG